MKQLFIIEDNLENKVSYYHLALFLVLLPYDLYYSELVVVSFIFHTLIHLRKERLRSALNRENFLLASVFMLTVTGMLWSQNNDESVKDLERRLTILLFPFLLSVTGLDLFRYKRNLLLLFSASCTLTILGLFACVIYSLVHYHLPLTSLFSSSFINHNFSKPAGIHATYLSLYVSLSLASLLWFLIKEKNKQTRITCFICIIILAAGLIQLASRSVMIATISFLLLVFPFFITKQVRKKFALFMAAISIGALLIILKIDSFKERYLVEFKEDLVQEPGQDYLLEPRIMRWESALKLVKQSPIIGYGSGSQKRLLQDAYFRDKLYGSYLHELNTHNQYLSFLLAFGIMGLLVFLITLFTGFSVAWRSRDVLFLCFLLLVSIPAFSENILNVNKGIFFYAFFFSFFIKTAAIFKKSPSIHEKESQ